MTRTRITCYLQFVSGPLGRADGLTRLIAIVVCLALLTPLAPLQAKTAKGDGFFSRGRVEEDKGNWDGALENYQKALAEDSAEFRYQLAVDKARFHAGQAHIDKGLTLRGEGRLGEALIEFQKASAVNPASAMAFQVLRETLQMILRERQRVELTGKEAPPEQRALTPGQEAEWKEERKIDRMLPAPELRQSKSGLIDLKMTGKAKVIFETLGAYANPPINVLWDPDYQNPAHDSLSVNLKGSTLDQALDYVSLLSKSYWKPISSNAIFVTNDNPAKRHEYEEQVMKTIYLHNVSGPQELQEVVNAVRTVPELSKVFPDTAQYAIVIKGEADRVALAVKIAHDLDKPRPEVLLDFLVMEASSTFSRQITAAVASSGLNIPINFSPRSSIQVQSSSTSSTTSTASSTTTSSGSSSTTSSTAESIPLSSLGHLSSADFSTTLPSALLEAAMSDSKTTVLQAPELRCIDNVKSTLNIGEREPTATGSYSSGAGTATVSALVNTQFQYIDIGVNIEVLARVHSDSEVSASVVLNITSVTGTVSIGGINEPIIGQRKIQHDLRMKEGEVALLGGLLTRQDDKTVTGIPGLSSVPLLGNLFKGSSVDHNRDDIVIAVIPHIIRKPEFSEENERTIGAGAQSIKITYQAPAPDEAAPAGATAQAAPATDNPLAAATLPAPSDVALQFAPQTVEATVGKTFTVAILAGSVSDLGAASVLLKYDPKMLRLSNAAVGDLLAQGDVSTRFINNIQNEAGTALLQISRPPGSKGAAGKGALVNLSFAVVSSGDTQITLPEIALQSSEGTVMEMSSPALSVRIK